MAMPTVGFPTISPSGSGSGGAAPVEQPYLVIMREGSTVNGVARFGGHINGTAIWATAPTAEKAIAAFAVWVKPFYGMVGAARPAGDPAPEPPSDLQEIRALCTEILDAAKDGKLTLADIKSQAIAMRDALTKELVKIQEHLAGAATEQPPAPPAPPVPPTTSDIDPELMTFLASEDPDPATFVPEVFTAYHKIRCLTQLRAEYSMRGTRFSPTVPTAMKIAVLRSLFAGVLTIGNEPAQDVFERHGVTPEAAVYAALSGRINELFQSVELGSRIEKQIIELGGHDAEWMFNADISSGGQGGNPGGGGNDSSTGSVPPRGV